MLMPFEYYGPKTVDEVDTLLRERPDSTLFAGGTNLVVDMELDHIRPTHLINIKEVAGLNEMDLPADGPAFIGAAVPISRLCKSSRAPWQCIEDAVDTMATPQVRNRATLIGNLCNASPAADMAPPMLVLGTTLSIRKTDGSTGSIALENFFKGVNETALAPGEWVIGANVGSSSGRGKSRFYKKQRVRGHDLAIVNVAGLCNPELGKLRIAVGSCAETPLLFDFSQHYADSKSLTEIESLILTEVAAGIKPIDDVRATAEYRKDMALYFTKRLLAEIYC